jgi:MFS family permease
LLSWRNQVSRYQWIVLLVAWLGWVFDSMDGTLYSLVQKPSMTELMGPGASEATVGQYSGYVFAATLLGWATGGVAFGVVADYLGRTKALVATILLYSLFTGLSATAHTWEQLAVFRFITGLGLGGEWAAGAALVAEVWPDHLRAKAGAILQSAAALGYFLAALINLWVGALSWRYVYLVGALPAVFVLFIRLLVKEPERWVAIKEQRRAGRRMAAKAASSDGPQLGSLANADGATVLTTRREEAATEVFTLRELFGPALRRDTIVASTLAFVALFALWGATMWIPSAVREVLGPRGLPAAELNRSVSYAVMVLNAGALVGYLAFGSLADRFGRKATFLIYLIGGVVLFPATFLLSADFSWVMALLPALGFFTLGITSGFPVYLPELFPTRVRATGVGFCYNSGRYIAASGPFIAGYLVAWSGGSYTKAASAISLIYLGGMLALLFARETRGERLA